MMLISILIGYGNPSPLNGERGEKALGVKNAHPPPPPPGPLFLIGFRFNDYQDLADSGYHATRRVLAFAARPLPPCSLGRPAIPPSIFDIMLMFNHVNFDRLYFGRLT